MPAGITVEFAKQATSLGNPNIGDLAFGVFENFAKDKVAQTQRYVAHPFVRRMAMHAERTAGGPKRTDIRLRENGTARFVSPFEITPNIRVDLMGRLESNIKHVEAHYIFDDKEEAFNSDSERRLYDHLKQQFNATIIDKFDFAEAAGWGGPLNSSDLTSVEGMEMKLGYLGTNVESEGTFGASYGHYGNGGTTQTLQGMDLTDAQNARAISWGATYSGRVDETLFAIISKAVLNTRFQFVPGLKQTLTDGEDKPTGQSYASGGSALYVPSAQYLGFVEYANKKVGKSSDTPEVNTFFKEIMVDGLLVVHAPYLDNFTSAPLIAINSEEIYVEKLIDRMFKWIPTFRYGLEQNKIGCVSSFLVHNQNPRQSGFRIHKKIAA